MDNHTTHTAHVTPCPWQTAGYRLAVVTYWDGRPVRTDYGRWHATRESAAADTWADGLVKRPEPCEVDDCDAGATPCVCGAAHCETHPHTTV
jgi:hypothetical protein